jgi:hypothetical protein
MRRLAFNRLWVQISLVIAGVVLVAALALLGVTYSMRPPEPTAPRRRCWTRRRKNGATR